MLVGTAMARIDVARLAQVIALPITASGVLVSLYIGISTLRELRAERKYRVRPFCIFKRGGFGVHVELEDKYGIPGIQPQLAGPLPAPVRLERIA
jgi:hypothetical protein